MPLLLLRLRRGLQGEVEVDFGKPPADAVRRCRAGSSLKLISAISYIAGRVGKVIVQVLVTVEVHLCCQVAMSRRRDEEVDMRRALAVAARLVEQLLGSVHSAGSRSPSGTMLRKR